MYEKWFAAACYLRKISHMASILQISLNNLGLVYYHLRQQQKLSNSTNEPWKSNSKLCARSIAVHASVTITEMNIGNVHQQQGD